MLTFIKHRNIRKKITRWLGRRSTRGLLGLGVAAAGILVLAGGGVYAALGGFSQPVTSSTIELQKGLVGWWKLDGNVKDSTPYGSNGTATSLTATTDRKGTAASAYSFGGSPSNINVGTAAALTMGTSSWTIGAWVKSTNTTSFQTIVSRRNGGPATGYTLAINAGKAYARFDTATAGTSVEVYGTTTVANGNWHYVAVTINRSNFMSIYVDGVNQNAANVSAYSSDVISTATAVRIGEDSFSLTNFFSGSMDDVRIYNRSLSQGEVTALYTQYDARLNAASGERALAGWWKLDGDAKDATPHQDNGVISGATPVADRKGTPNSAYSFDGTSSKISIPTGPTTNLSSSAFSVSFWLQDNGSGIAFPTVMNKNNAGTVGAGWSIFYNSSTKAILFKRDNVQISSFTGVVSSSTPQLFTFIYDGTNGTWYVNGVIKSTPISTTYATETDTGNLTLGTTLNSAYGKMTLDDVRIYNRAIAVSDISNLYNSYNSQINLNSSPTNQSTVNLNSGLVGYWPFNGNAKDSTPYQRNGTVTGATLGTDRKGRANSAYSFNGTSSSYINTTGQFSVPTNAVTVSAWINLANVTTNNMIVVKENANTQWELMVENASLRWVGGSGYNSSLYCTGMTAGVWYHVVGTQTGTTATLYRNGVQCGTATQPAITNGTGYLDIGRYNGGYYYNGSIDDVRVYNRALSSTEVSALYNNYY